MTQSLKFLLTADDKASSVFARVRGELTRMEGDATLLKRVLGGLGPALGASLSLAGLGGFAKSVVAGLDSLNDLKDATGASIENLSALEDVALRTGTRMETAGDSVIRLNKALNEAKADPNSGAAQTLKQLGLNIDELLAMDPVAALQKVGSAINGFADNGAKGRAQLVLLGKATKEQAAFLKELGAAGTLVATVTTAQAEEAEKLRKEWSALEKNAIDLARVLGGPVISALNQTIDLFREGSKEGRGFFETMRAEQLKLLGLASSNDDQAKAMRGEIERIDKLLAGGFMMTQRRTALEEKRVQLAKELEAVERRMRDPVDEMNGHPMRQSLPRLPDLGDPDKPGRKATGSPKAKPEFSVPQWLREMAGARELQYAELNAKGREAEVQEQQRRLDAVLGITDEIREANLRLTVELVQDEKARAAALIMLDERVQMKKLESLQVYGQAYEAAQAAIKDQTGLRLRSLEQEVVDIKAVAKDAGAEIGLVFASAAGDAVRHWQGVKGLIKGIGTDLLQIGIKRAVTDPLGELVGSSLKGFSWPSLFGSLPGFATGTDYVPRDMFARIHKGERIVPAAQNRGGVGGGSIALNNVVHIDSRTDQAQVAAAVAEGVHAGNRQLLTYLKAQGAV